MAAAIHQIPELDAKGLRSFALVTGSVVVGLFGLFFPWLLELAWPRWPWILAAVLVTLGLVVPMSLQLVYRNWMRFGLIINKITTPIIMGLVFFLIITPIGLFRRISAGDAMKRKFDARDSYRIPSDKPPPKKMERPF